MSYSFQIRAATAALALAAVAEKLDEVVAQQPIHVADRAHAEEVAKAFVGLLPASEADHDVIVHMHGSVTEAAVSEGAPQFLLGAGVGVNAYLAPKETASEG